MNLLVKSLIIEENGEITVRRSFDDRLTVIEGETCDLLQSVLRAVLGYGGPPVAYPGAVRFLAEVQAERRFFVRGSADGEPSVFRLQAHDADGKACEKEYAETLRQSAEERSANCFSDFKRQKYPHRLFRYRDPEIYYPTGAFSKRTDGFGVTRCFRGFLRQYVREFRPIRLRDGKDFWLHLQPNGKFAVKTCGGAECAALSESESTLYQYLCFLCLAEFWSAAEQLRDLHHPRKPLLVNDFLERLDRSIDVSEILERTARLDRQTFLFAPAYNPK